MPSSCGLRERFVSVCVATLLVCRVLVASEKGFVWVCCNIACVLSSCGLRERLVCVCVLQHCLCAEFLWPQSKVCVCVCCNIAYVLSSCGLRERFVSVGVATLLVC